MVSEDGGKVILIRLDQDALMGVRFAISPLAQMGFMLNFGMTSMGGARRVEWKAWGIPARREVQLVNALQREVRSYAPGFMFPDGDGMGSAEDELQQVAAAPVGVIVRQMDRFLRSARAEGRSETPGLRTVMTALERGERSFAQRVALELGCLWRECLAPRWRAVQSLIEGDIQYRAAAVARRGLGAALGSLHPALSYRSGALRIQDERTWTVSDSKRIVLHPSPLAKTWMLRDDPWGDSGIHLAYPVRPGPADDVATAGQAKTNPLGRVIGHARLVLLADLGRPRTTTELAGRLHMSPSTVSYHLVRLHRVGLLNRTREGSRVYYRRTSEADRLVASRERHPSSGPVLVPSPVGAEEGPRLLDEVLS
ncbi:ArsR/SmtB family transcription factor [Streptomyces sp. NPDC090493]|uniref:ArsR/SmtB family transcription factor n=1 Tax=Streptomyces sp. NPDC090493 TaxID=3365964 RepID=UPI00381BB766